MPVAVRRRLGRAVGRASGAEVDSTAAKIVAIGADEVAMLLALAEALTFAEIDAGADVGRVALHGREAAPLRCMCTSRPSGQVIAMASPASPDDAANPPRSEDADLEDIVGEDAVGEDAVGEDAVGEDAMVEGPPPDRADSSS